MAKMQNSDIECDISVPKQHDLRNRERVNFVVDSSLMQKLRALSDNSKIPMSRMIDIAIQKTYKLDTESIFTSIFLISHDIKIYIYRSTNSAEMLHLYGILKAHRKKYIFSDCFLSQVNRSRTMGTLLHFFIDDGEEDALNECKEYLCLNKIEHEIHMDDVLTR